MLKKLAIEDFKDCLNKHCIMTKPQSTIKSHLHHVYSITTDKKVLDPFDDKRYIVPGTHNTLAWGHYNAPNAFENV